MKAVEPECHEDDPSSCNHDVSTTDNVVRNRLHLYCQPLPTMIVLANESRLILTPAASNHLWPRTGYRSKIAVGPREVGDE